MPIQCTEVQEWVEEEVLKPVEEWVEQAEEKCKKRPWWDPLGWICWLVTTLIKVVTWVVEKVGKWVIRTVCKFVSTVVDLVVGVIKGLWNVLAGIFTLDWRRILDGLIEIGGAVVDAFFSVVRIVFLLDTIAYIIEEVERGQLRDHIRALLEAKYRGDELDAIKRAIRLDHGAFGLRLTFQSVRTFLDSEAPSPREPGVPNLVLLHESGAINLRELCGFEFTEGFWNRKRYKTLKKELVVAGGGGGEFDNPISAEELDSYLSSRGAQGPKFVVLCMRDSVLDTKLRACELKARELGLIPSWSKRDLEVVQARHIVQPGFDTNVASSSLVNFLIDPVGRADQGVAPAQADCDQCTPTAVGVFRYTDSLRGLAACLKGSFGSDCQPPHDACGVTYIDNKPDIVWKYVPIHEIGHFFGLCHVDGLDRIMYSSKQNSWFTWKTIPKLLFLTGEPTFILDEAKEAWNYIVANFPAECLKGQPCPAQPIDG